MKKIVGLWPRTYSYLKDNNDKGKKAKKTRKGVIKRKLKLEDFRDMCLRIYELDPVKFVSAPGLARQAALKKTQVKLDLLTDVDMILMVEKGIGGGICNSLHWYTKANNKYMSDYDENKESSYINYWDMNHLYGWAINISEANYRTNMEKIAKY